MFDWFSKYWIYHRHVHAKEFAGHTIRLDMKGKEKVNLEVVKGIDIQNFGG